MGHLLGVRLWYKVNTVIGVWSMLWTPWSTPSTQQLTFVHSIPSMGTWACLWRPEERRKTAGVEGKGDPLPACSHARAHTLTQVHTKKPEDVRPICVSVKLLEANGSMLWVSRREGLGFQTLWSLFFTLLLLGMNKSLHSPLHPGR